MRIRTILRAALSATLLLGACGDDDGNGNNGDNPDAAPRADAGPTPDASPTAATCGIQVFSGSDRVGNLVSFNRPDGSLIGTAITDVDGKATRDDCVADTQLSMYEINSTAVQGLSGYMTTVQGVQPGDTVVFNWGGPWEPEPPTATMNIAGNANVGGLTAPVAYEWSSGCDSDGGPIPGGFTESGITGFPPCLGSDNNFDVVQIAWGESEDIVGFSLGTAAFVANTTIPVAMGAWTAVASAPVVTVTLNNPPAMATEYWTAIRQKRDFVSYREYEYGGDPVSASMVNASSPNELWPPGAFTTHELLVRLGYAGSPLGFGSPIASGFATGTAILGVAPADSHTVNLATTMLPRIAGAYVTNDGNASRPTISWLTDGDVSSADAAMAILGYGEGFPENDGPRGVWLFVSPSPGAGSLQAPVLPDALASFAPMVDEPVLVILASIVDADYLDYQSIITRDVQGLFGLIDIPFASPGGPELSVPPPGATYSGRSSLWMDATVLANACNVGGTGSNLGFGLMVMLGALVIRRRRRK